MTVPSGLLCRGPQQPPPLRPTGLVGTRDPISSHHEPSSWTMPADFSIEHISKLSPLRKPTAGTATVDFLQISPQTFSSTVFTFTDNACSPFLLPHPPSTEDWDPSRQPALVMVHKQPPASALAAGLRHGARTCGSPCSHTRA